MSATLTPTDARELLERALWFSRQALFDVPGASERRARWRENDAEARHDLAAAALLTAAVRLAAYAGEPQLLSLVLQALDVYGSLVDPDEPLATFEPFADAICWLLRLGAPVDREVVALARHPEPSIREALVRGLQDAAAEFEAVIRPLTDDRDASVRNVAKEALATLGTPPWWVGVFSFDPGTVIPEQDGPALSPKLARYAELVNKPHGMYGEAREELYRLIDELPDVLARDVVLRHLAGERYSTQEERLAARYARIPDTVRSVVELLERSDRYQHHRFVQTWAEGAVGDREALAREVMAAIERRDPSERFDTSQPTWSLSDLAVQLWPPESDATEFVERILSEDGEEEEEELRLDAYTAFADAAGSRSPITIERSGPRLIASFLEGDPHRWCRRLHRLTRAALASLSLETRREAAHRALRSPNDEVVQWGLEQVLDSAHDPVRDPPVDELFDRLTRDERLRTLLVQRQDQVRRFRSSFLGLLHTGELSSAAAARVVSALAAPGQTMFYAYLHRGLDLPLAPASGPPLSADDFAAFRRIRDADPGPPLYDVLFSLPAEELSIEDRRYTERALETGDEELEFAVAVVLAIGGAVSDVPVVERLVRQADADDVDGLVDRMKARLGLIPPKVRGRPAQLEGTEAPREWMDEDD